MKNEKLQQIIEESQKGIDSFQSVKALAEGLMEPEGISDYEGVRAEDGTIVLTWKGRPEKSLDVQFQTNGKGKWHSVQWMLKNNYNPPSLNGTMNLYQFQIPKEKPVRVELLEGHFDKEMNVFVAKKTHGVLGFEAIEESSDGGDEDSTKSKTIPIITNEIDNGFQGWYAGVNGIIEIDGKWRVYFQDRTDSNSHQVVFSESSDLKNWTNPKPVGTSKNIYFVKHQGQIYAYAEDDHAMNFWKSNDGINHFEYIGRGYEWKLDTAFTLYFHEDNNQPRMFGRVRGTGEEGGWDTHKDIDRRGISYHKTSSDLSGNWESKNIADPMDYFDYSKDLQADFYQPSFRPDGTGEVVVYFRDRDNTVENYKDGRITGPIYPVKARYGGGKIHVDSWEPAVDLSSFIKGEKHYGDITVRKLGQCYIHPEKIEHNNEVWRVVSYRDDEHYRKREDGQELSGIYLVKEK